jgi:hypothetical protein
MFELTYIRTIETITSKYITIIECDKFDNKETALEAVNKLKVATDKISNIFLIDNNKEFLILNGKEF